jgi:proteic killer suppression protein
MSIYLLQNKKMIESFRHSGPKRFYQQDDRRKLPPDMVDRIASILAALDAATTIAALNRPSFRLHRLKGGLKGFWAITVRANWRIIFRFEDGKVFDVDLADYH